uniref:Uncharacterized protein n=1 Tax=Sphaerodactylus townsendi TaxID=933632 RepID=A0ACB8EDE6_9SAUR
MGANRSRLWILDLGWGFANGFMEKARRNRKRLYCCELVKLKRAIQSASSHSWLSTGSGPILLCTEPGKPIIGFLDSQKDSGCPSGENIISEGPVEQATLEGRSLKSKPHLCRLDKPRLHWVSEAEEEEKFGFIPHVSLL